MRSIALLIAAAVTGCTAKPGPVIGAPRWAVSVGGDVDDEALAAAFDSVGDVVIIGDSTASNRFSGSFLTSLSPLDGSVRWSTSFGNPTSPSVVEVRGLAIAADDSIYVTGDYVGTVDFGGQVLTTTIAGDMFLAKYTVDGELAWAHGLSSTASATGERVAIDDQGHVLVAGTFTAGTLNLAGRGYSVPRGTTSDGFVAAFDTAGTLIWGQAFVPTPSTMPTSCVPTDMLVAANGDILITGTFDERTTFGGISVDPEAFRRAYLVRVDSTGSMLDALAVGAGGEGMSNGADLTVTPEGVIVLHTIDTLPGVLPTNKLHAVSDGDIETWSTTQLDHGSIFPNVRALTLAKDGRLATSAWVDAPYNADAPDTVTGHMEVVAYDPSGKESWSGTFGSRHRGYVDATTVHGAAVDAGGATVFVGRFGGILDFGYGPLDSHGQNDTDAFVVYLDPP